MSGVSEPPNPDEPPTRLSVELLDLATSVGQRDVRLREIMERLEGRVYTLLLVLLALPFCQPIALPGVSTPFGVVIALLGLRFSMRQKPWLPRRLLDTVIPHRFLPMVLRAGGRMLSVLEKCLHPRWTGLFEYRATQFASGSTIFFCGMLLLLPLPVPFSNLLPALAVVVIAASFSERDGLMLAAGGGIFAVTLLFFGVIFFGGIEAASWLKDQFGEFFHPGEEPPLFGPPVR